MKILLVYPEYPDTFWSFKHALKSISKKAAFPPLGLLTVAAMLPLHWDKRLVDMNTSPLTDEDIRRADYVFISAMSVQSASAKEVIERCRGLGAKTVAGGPLFTMTPEEFEGVDHLVLGEAEVTLRPFLEDLEKGCPRPIYSSASWPEMGETPVPLWSLIDMKQYATMSLQYSRGCPFDCEFCDIVVLNGRIPRTKTAKQFISELDDLYERGWRGGVFIVDDNFIGNKKKLKTEILPALIEWRKTKQYPFAFSTEASINLADDDVLLKLMIAAGLEIVFIGIETPNEDSLVECSKSQNQNRDLVEAVKKLQRSGMEVQGGFIVGFDSDPDSIFQTQIDFIQKSGIVTAMVGLLNIPAGTRLYHRMKAEGRLTGGFTGDSTDFSLNFVPKMQPEKLIRGYRRVLEEIHSPANYYARIETFFKTFKPPRVRPGKIQLYQIKAFFWSIWHLGVFGPAKRHYWKLFLWSLFRSPPKLARLIIFSINGYHFRKIFSEHPTL